jgi:hypothetical protein
VGSTNRVPMHAGAAENLFLEINLQINCKMLFNIMFKRLYNVIRSQFDYKATLNKMHESK